MHAYHMELVVILQTSDPHDSDVEDSDRHHGATDNAENEEPLLK